MRIETSHIIKIIDFWKKCTKPKKLHQRLLLKKINHKSNEVIDLLGARRSGKSSLLKLIIQNLNLKDNFLFINFEDPFFINHNDPLIIEDIIETFQEYFNPKLKYLFFDEIQQINQWPRAIRKLRDSGQFKIFVTGSSSKLLSSEIGSLLTGRHLSYFVSPLSFIEFLSFKKVNIKQKKDIALNEKKLLRNFYKYLKIGGFPEMVLNENPALLKNYFFDILQKDIIVRYDIREKRILEKIAVYILSNAGKIISIEAIKNNFNISYSLVSSYLEYLKEAFMIFELSQFSYSLKKQHKALKKIYSADTGLSNIISFKFSEDKGRMLENLVFLELIRQEKEIFYYKTKNNLEVAFFIREKNKANALIQVTWQMQDEKTRQREIKSLLTAMEETKLNKGLILTENESKHIKRNSKKITIMPVYQWLLENNL